MSCVRRVAACVHAWLDRPGRLPADMATSALVWISGASGGIGAALAASVPFEGAHTFDLSRSGGAPGTEHVPADLSDPAAWAAVAAHFDAVLGDTEAETAVFVHNAGTLDPMGFAGRVDQAAYTRNVLLNSAAPQVLGNAFLAAVGRAPSVTSASLVLLSSGAASKPYEGWSSYCGAKAGVDHWVRTVGAEQASTDNPVKVVAVAPGVVGTGMQEYIRAQDEAVFPAKEKFVGLYERGELVDPADAATGIWSVVQREDIETGAVIDLRKLSPAS